MRQSDRAVADVRTLGATGLAVSRIGLGLAALGRPGYINLGHAQDLEAEYDIGGMEARTHRVLDAAWAEGVRYFDAARSYGRAEHFLAAWLTARGIAPAAAVVGSKWGYTYTAAWRVDAPAHEVKEHSAAVLRRQWGESRALLGSHLDLYQIHSATLESGALENREVLEELVRLRREEGVYIGLTLSGPMQAETLRRALELRPQGERIFDAVQATWNLLEPSAGEALREARAAGMGVIVKEALANGRLTARNHDPDFASRRSLLDRQAERLGGSLDALALRAVLAQPWCDVVLSGAATTEHLASNLTALRLAWDDEAAERLSTLAEPPEVYWHIRGNLEWN